MSVKEMQTLLAEPPDYDEERDDTFAHMIGQFYNRKMTTIVLFVWAFGLLFMGGAIAMMVLFCYAVEIKMQILYAALFLLFMQFLGTIKVFAWQIIHRNSIKREIKRLEICIQDLADRLK